MTLGYALIVVVVLYLIDKHNRWQIVAKIALGLVALSLLGLGGFYGWTKYDAYRTAKREATEAATLQKRTQECIARNANAGFRDIFDSVSAQEACEKDPNTLPPCWSKPLDPEGFQTDQNNFRDLSGKLIPPTPNTICYPIALKAFKAPLCKNGLVAGCIDKSPMPWTKYGQTQIYLVDGKRYEVPKGTTLDELGAALKIVASDSDYAKASPEDQKEYLAYVIGLKKQPK